MLILILDVQQKKYIEEDYQDQGILYYIWNSITSFIGRIEDFFKYQMCKTMFEKYSIKTLVLHILYENDKRNLNSDWRK